MQFLKEKYSIYCVFLIFSILSWVSITHTKRILDDIRNPISLVILSSFLTFIIILFMVCSGITSSPKDTWKDIGSIASNDMLLLLLVAVVFSFGRILFTTLLKHHDPRTIKITGYMISTLVSGGALYAMKRKSFTPSRYLGFTLMAIGGYLFIA